MSMYSYSMFMYLHCASWHSSATLTKVFPCFFLSCKANARVKPTNMGHSPHPSKIFLLYYCHRVATQLQLTNIYHIIIRGLAITTLPWMLELWSSPRIVFVEPRWILLILSSAATFAAAVPWFTDKILFNVWHYVPLSLVFGHHSSLLMSHHDLCIPS
jgi:hypothetical protein